MNSLGHELLQAQLASLLEIEPEIARLALTRSAYNFEGAVQIACELLASGGTSTFSRSASALSCLHRTQQSFSGDLDAVQGLHVLSDDEGGSGEPSSSSASSSRPMRQLVSDAGGNGDGNVEMEVAEVQGPQQQSSSSSSSSGPLADVQVMEAVTGVAAGMKRIAPQAAETEVFAPMQSRKRSRHAQEEEPFKLRGNSEDAPADNPRGLQAHPLREEQRRSLSWMLSQEQRKKGLKGGLLADKMGYGKTSTTIGLISLDPPLPAPQQSNRKKNSQAQHPGYIDCSATLILCPSHLVQQWRGEFVKFLGSEGVAVWRPPFVQGKGAFKMLVVETIHELKRLRWSDILDGYNAVLVSSSIPGNASYLQRISSFLRLYRRSEVVGKKAWGYGAKTGVKLEMLREELKKLQENHNFDFSLEKLLNEKFPILEAFWWRRIVLDEFHESESWEYKVREMMKAVGATSRWGLSGTPPLGSSWSVMDVAELLGYTQLEKAPAMVEALGLYHSDSMTPTSLLSRHRLPHGVSPPNEEEKTRQSAREKWFANKDNFAQVRAEAECFVDCFVRQNSSMVVEAIQIVEHEEIVHFTDEERLIYRQACHDNEIYDLESGYAGVSLTSRATLLKRCAHFDFSKNGEDSAGSAVQRLGDVKQQRINDVQQQFRIEAARAVRFRSWQQAQRLLRNIDLQHADARSFLTNLLESRPDEIQAEVESEAWQVDIEYYDQRGELRVRPEVCLRQPLRHNEYCEDANHRHVVLHHVAQQQNQEAFRVLQGLHGFSLNPSCLSPAVVSSCEGLARLLDAAHRSLQFYKMQMRSISGDQEKEECTICLEEKSNVSTLSILPCAHVFHTACIRAIVAEQRKCPECRTPVAASQMTSLVMELQPRLAESKKPKAMLSPALRAHGSKLNAVAARLHQIFDADATAKAIVFVQWADLEDKVAAALRTHKIRFLSLPHDYRKRSSGFAALQQFQEDSGAEAARVILLSLEKVASGSNLTAASHVLFVHPMNAETVNTAVAYEKQAIGRVRRVGQTRSEVHVWRFITCQTVEEHIWRLHRAPDALAATPTRERRPM